MKVVKVVKLLQLNFYPEEYRSKKVNFLMQGCFWAVVHSYFTLESLQDNWIMPFDDASRSANELFNQNREVARESTPIDQQE